MTSDYAIDVKNLNKHFGDKQVVKDLSLQIGYGEIFDFLGPNGSGKTTSIRMMCGLLTPDLGGEGTCLGYDIIRQTKEIKQNVGYMTQRFSMWEDLTIKENLDFVARIYEIPHRKENVGRTLEQLGLEERHNQLAGALSGGWKQRLALGACLLHRPKLLLLDEPTAGVDPKARRDFWAQLHQLAAQGISILVSTHYMDEAERCHKLAYLSNGRLIIQGTAQEILASRPLLTFSVSGLNLFEFSHRLEGKPGVDQTIVFGERLHVTGEDGKHLTQTLENENKNKKYRIQPIETTLEDFFIYLMNWQDKHQEEKNK